MKEIETDGEIKSHASEKELIAMEPNGAANPKEIIEDDFVSDAESKIKSLSAKSKNVINHDERQRSKKVAVPLDCAAYCIQCGALGHWDCKNARVVFPEKNHGKKLCPCGSGKCIIITVNPGCEFFRCPVSDEDGGCGFFERCEDPSATTVSASNTSVADLPCPCDVDSKLGLTAKTGQNVRSPGKQVMGKHLRLKSSKIRSSTGCQMGQR